MKRLEHLLGFIKTNKSKNEPLIELFDRYAKLNNLNKYSVRNAEDMEIAATEAIYSRKALQSKTIDEFNESSYREFLKIKLKPFFKEEKQLNIQIENILSDVLKKNKKQD